MKKQRILITGGAGFIGSNLANRLLAQGHQLTIFDNLSRSGCESNLEWLRESHGSTAFNFIKGDLKDYKALLAACEGAERIYHLAGQVAVTTSVTDPQKDFLDNAQGTFFTLEAARKVGNDPIFIYASTNKVYGGMTDIRVIEENTRYRYLDYEFGIPETHPLDFHSPYGCSKGCGDQYTHDYARIYGLRTVVMRQSCIYGYRQYGVEDQGWVAWFIIAALNNHPITIYGDGKQVRDILFVEDLLDAYQAAIDHIDIAAGQIYNIGGGPENTMSIWEEFGPILVKLFGREIQTYRGDWRPGDQRIYVSNIQKAQQELGWHPNTSVHDGIERLFNWVYENRGVFSR